MVPSRRRIASALCLLIGVSITAYLRIHFGSAGPHSRPRIGEPLPPLKVDASGVAVDLNKFTAAGKSVIVFYSPSCRICRETLPALRPFPSTLRLIMVSESQAREDSVTLDIPNAMFFYDRWNVLTRSFASTGLPTIVFVDEGGILRDGLVGWHELELVQRKLAEFAARRY